ncbi:KRAB-A domain-containing protein 2 [Trichonephila clavipes]|nr:KRAB-A domain-containing protein 2 [Trichonephila clavipes]
MWFHKTNASCCSVSSLDERLTTILVKFDTRGVQETGRLIYLPYGVRGTVTELISVAPAFCLKEPMELRRMDEFEECNVRIRYALQSDIIGNVKEAHSGGFKICSGGGRKERNRQRGNWLFPAKSFVLLGVSQLCQSYASGGHTENHIPKKNIEDDLQSTTSSHQVLTEKHELISKKRAAAKENLLLQAIKMLRTSRKPDVDRGRTDNRNLLAVVVEIEDSDFYKFANVYGTLKQLYARN